MTPPKQPTSHIEKPRTWLQGRLALVALLLGILAALLLLGFGGDAALEWVKRSLSPTDEQLQAEAEKQTVEEIHRLSSAIAAFKENFNVSYVPSQLMLCENGEWPNTQLALDSQVFLQQMFGKRFSPSTPIDWNQDGVISQEPFILTGDQCLVFFLGGLPARGATPRCQGFSSNPTNPATPGGQRYGPFFDFKPDRLLLEAGNGFFSYLDRFGNNTTYAFFSSYKHNNGYNRYGASDCPLIPDGPYSDPTGKPGEFINPTGFQIISAGKDGLFGKGGNVWNPATGTADPPTQDNLTNFSTSPLRGPKKK
jgi:hypothetical protein